MKFELFFVSLILLSCNSKEPKSTQIISDSTNVDVKTNEQIQEPKGDTISLPETYSNKRFKDVSVDSMGNNKYRIRGLGQIFEANFNWIVEDGHEEILKGYQMTDAGAPEWGKFDFTIEVKKKRDNSTLTLVLFETSAMDGSRQHELPIVLY